MKSTLRTWTRLGLAGALAGGSLAGCAGESGEGEGGESAVSGEAGTGEAGTGEGGEAGEAAGGEGGEGAAADALPLPKRAAFMAGHVEAGLALYRAGDAEAAAPHLLHPVSETHASERAGLAELGFDAKVFEQVSAALKAGKPASEIEPQLQAAQDNMIAVAEKAGGDPGETITFLMETVIAEYNVGVTGGAVTDPGEYQDAFGFAVVAKQMSAKLNGDAATAVAGELDTLIAMFPEGGPIPPEKPAPAGQVSAQASKVMLALP